MSDESEDDLPHRPQADRVIPAGDIVVPNQDALRVLSRLQRSGYEAYLVGGCVRDLLLGRRPRDYDIATQAHPRQIKRLFRNGRIIGRRFRLVHVVYGDNVIETATFRSEDSGRRADDGVLITEDNEYGTAEEDARRRDFTINGLLLDPFEEVIHDYVGGLADLEAGRLRTIGDPDLRFAEDPVRILRAIKFATRLGFRIDDGTWRAMGRLAPKLDQSAKPRVLEEILRLTRSGTSLGAVRMMRASGALATLMPEVDQFLGTRDDPDWAAHDRADSYWRLLEALDNDIHAGAKPGVELLLAVLFLRVIEHKAMRAGDPNPLATGESDLFQLAGEAIEPLAVPARLSKRAVERAKRIIASQPRFTQPSTKTRSTTGFLMSEDFESALQLFRLRSAAWGQGWDVYEGWVERRRRLEELSPEEMDHLRRRPRRRRRSRRRRPRRRGGEENS